MRVTYPAVLLVVAVIAVIAILLAIVTPGILPARLDPDVPGPYGNVTGKVTSADCTAQAGIQVWLINASRPDTVYATTMTDSGGIFTFHGVDADDMRALSYRLHAETPASEGVSEPFRAFENETTSCDVVLCKTPDTIKIEPLRDNLIADGNDQVTIVVRLYGAGMNSAAGNFIVTLATEDVDCAGQGLPGLISPSDSKYNSYQR